MSLVSIVFIVFYLIIIAESYTKIDKAVPALLMGGICWIIIFLKAGTNLEELQGLLSDHLSSIAEIVLFLIGAMTIVELIDAHKGFVFIQKNITTKSKWRFLIIIALLSYFLSAVLDNLTTSIVMCSIISKSLDSRIDRLYFASIIIIAANAGGAWSPIGDITTTMLWISKKVSVAPLIYNTFIPSLISVIIPIIGIWLMNKKILSTSKIGTQANDHILYGSSKTIFWIGIVSLIGVPVMKNWLHTPPYLAMLIALAFIWLCSEFIDPKIFPYNDELKKELSIKAALSRIEMPSILFFTGILLAIAALESEGSLHNWSEILMHYQSDPRIIAIILGVFSAVIDNVPLVAATINMYDLPMDNSFWHFLSYCAGTGGSILVIGSAAGIVTMGIEKIEFFWYLKKISLWALLGYIGGCVFMLIFQL